MNRADAHGPLRAGSEEKPFKLMSKADPLLREGRYTVRAQQQVERPAQELFDPMEQLLEVGYPHFQLLADDIHAMYPPPGQTGDFSRVLPHICLKQKTVPWERTLDGGSPWLALLCLREGEIAGRETLPIRELCDPSRRPADVFFPMDAVPALAAETEDMQCQVLDVARETFQAIFPRLCELPYLAHVKMVDAQDKQDALTEHDGCYSAVIANRFPPSSAQRPEQCHLHLVSLEGYGPYLPGGSPPDSRYARVRLVSLVSWQVFSQTSLASSFREVFENLSVDMLLAPPADECPDTLKNLLRRGLVPKTHVTRTGERTVSVCRGPFLPYDVRGEDGSNRPAIGAFSADQSIIYDPAAGIFDMTYAAAWQLGRLMILNNKSILQLLHSWRGDKLRRAAVRMNRQTFARRLADFTPDNELLGFLAFDFAHALEDDHILGHRLPRRRDNDADMDG